VSRDFDAMVLGGGPAGAALGTLLARAGRTVAILEKTCTAHDKVCGEFLSHEAIRYLRALGIEPAAMGATPVDRVSLAGRALFGQSALPFTGMSLRRRVLDEVLLTHAQEAGAGVERGACVEALEQAHWGWTARLANGETRRAATVFLATGKHDLHGWNRPPGSQDDLVAFKMYFQLTRGDGSGLESRVELVLFPGGYAGLLFLPGGVMNLCLLVKKAAFQRIGSRWSRLLEHVRSSSFYLAGYLDGATALLEKPLALSSIPYGYVRCDAQDGLWRLGDQAAVIPSFSGDGISIALHSAHLAAAHFLEGGSADEYQKNLHAQLRRPVRAAALISRLMVGTPMLANGVRLWPRMLGVITDQTRIPQSALISAAG
jgi:flavin-dependent dehydrogenase